MANVNSNRFSLDLVEATASDLRKLLEGGTITSRVLIEQCLNQIEQYDRQGPELRAMITIAPREKLFQWADRLDKERDSGKLRGPLHGIPIIVKDIYNTHADLEMPTTQGSFAMKNSINLKNAILIDKLIEHGLIVLGKANLSEFGAAKGEKGLGGLSAIGGQCQSPYIPGGVIPGDKALGHSNPGGSSTGPAVGVAAGYSPISLGGEADGSINTPASRAALYALKATPQSLPSEGVFLVAPTFESPGGMAKSVKDLADLMRIILSTSVKEIEVPDALPSQWNNITLGFVDPAHWQLPPDLMTSDANYSAQIKRDYETAIDTLTRAGCSVEYPVEILHPRDLVYNGSPGYLFILLGELRDSVNTYLANLHDSEVRSLEEIINFNKANPELQAGIDQLYHVQCQENQTPAEILADARTVMKLAAGRNGIDPVMDRFGLDAIVAPMDSPISTIAALAGYPSATVPLGYHDGSGRPYGLCLVAKAGEEGKLLSIMSAYEATMPKRRYPPLLQKGVSAR